MGQRLNPFGVLQVVHLVRQDLSIAGKRAGLAGARSGLFMEQVRIVKEMREADKRNGRTGDMVRPRYLVWENVVGAFSSNKGKDFAAVLEEIIKIVEPEAPGIEVPEKGWPTWGGYHDEMGGRWSVVWRTHDAQYWGVPQRRRRISVVADFGGDTASEIQFDGESLSGDIAESGASGEGPAEAAERGFNPAGGDCMTAWDCQSKRIFDTNGKSPTLQGGVGGGVNNPAIFCMATQQGGAELRIDDRAPTLTAAAGMSGNNQPVVAIPINDKATRWQGGGESRNHDGGGNGLGIGKEGDPFPTLTAGDRHGVAYLAGVDGYNGELTGDVASTLGVNCGMSTGRNGVMELSANENGGMARDSVLCAGFKAGQGAQAGGIGYGEEVSPTLAAAPSGTNQTPAVMAFDTTQITSKENGSQPEFGKPCHTLNANAHVPCVALDMTHACDVIRECGEQVPALQNRMGTGGNQVPLTYGIGNGQANEAGIMAVEVSQTLNTMHDAQAVMCEDVAHTLRAKANCAYREDAETYPVQNMVVRRLTPLECTRLQGYPDGWVDIGDWTDEKGKKHKDADSPKYKALGNSIALPFWDWMLRRMARYLPEGATLGSLFDGIAGFPLIWERIHGKGMARWASEIEPFPIAVTKKWLGEE
jgi:DNA (cytosine-5)-methyltransferase 1